MITINFTDSAIKTLQSLHQTHPHPTIRRRAHVLLLKSASIPHHRVAQITGYCENTVRHYLRVYLNEGILGLEKINFYRPAPKLKPFESIVREYIEKTPPTHIAKACADIEKLTGISLKQTQMRAYLTLLGIRCRKVSSVPAKVNLQAQQAFHDHELQPRLEEAKSGKRDVYFVDAAHFVLGAFLGYLWSFVRVFVRTPSGRQRFNVLGALNAVTKQLVSITNDTYITSIQVCELLQKLAKDATKPVTLVLDNARYQRCKLVMGLAAELHIELVFLPPYSPNLNLIERLWKLVKKECLYSKYYETFSLFSHTITDFLKNMNATHPEKLNDLLTLNFQLFTEEQIKKAA
jgi:transposase